jgi:hypothetical protein
MFSARSAGSLRGVQSRDASTVPLPWRDDDEVLLARLEDRELVRQLWRAQAPAMHPEPPHRAEVLVRQLRSIPEAAEALARARAGQVEALYPWLTLDGLAGRTGALIHATALWYERLGEAFGTAAREARADGRVDEQLAAAAEHSSVRAMGLWLVLAEERSFLSGLGRQVAGPSLPAGEAERIAVAAATRSFEELGETARLGARELDLDSSQALRLLGFAPEACRIARLSSSAAAAHLGRAERLRADAIDEALSPSLGALREAKLSKDPIRASVEPLRRIAGAWRWSGFDAAVERCAAEEVEALGWEVYRESRWSELRTLLEPCMSLFESLERRMLASPSAELSHRAKCAQLLVFRSEADMDPAREWAFAERALAVCPSHRNARLVLAHLACDRAIRRLDRATFLTVASDLSEATGLVARAEQLFPQGRRMEEAHRKLEEAKRQWGRGP